MMVSDVLSTLQPIGQGLVEGSFVDFATTDEDIFYGVDLSRSLALSVAAERTNALLTQLGRTPVSFRFEELAYFVFPPLFDAFVNSFEIETGCIRKPLFFINDHLGYIFSLAALTSSIGVIAVGGSPLFGAAFFINISVEVLDVGGYLPAKVSSVYRKARGYAVFAYILMIAHPVIKAATLTLLIGNTFFTMTNRPRVFTPSPSSQLNPEQVRTVDQVRTGVNLDAFYWKSIPEPVAVDLNSIVTITEELSIGNEMLGDLDKLDAWRKRYRFEMDESDYFLHRIRTYVETMRDAPDSSIHKQQLQLFATYLSNFRCPLLKQEIIMTIFLAQNIQKAITEQCDHFLPLEYRLRRILERDRLHQINPAEQNPLYLGYHNDFGFPEERQHPMNVFPLAQVESYCLENAKRRFDDNYDSGYMISVIDNALQKDHALRENYKEWWTRWLDAHSADNKTRRRVLTSNIKQKYVKAMLIEMGLLERISPEKIALSQGCLPPVLSEIST